MRGFRYCRACGLRAKARRWSTDLCQHCIKIISRFKLESAMVEWTTICNAAAGSGLGDFHGGA